ncbi:hypothetical protein, partial [Mycobacterium canetti]|uniref:hypothetical protein n=1 Tax=Mycobacterium canetti TaxID=78331 RepID=UPI001EE7428A
MSEPTVTAADPIGTGLRVLGPIRTVGAGIQASTQCTVKQRDTLRADPINVDARGPTMEYLIAAQDVLVAAAADLEGIGS